MSLYKFKLVIIFLILSITGCTEKDELTLPVKVYLEIGISPDDPLNTDYLVLTECLIGIQSIRFEGEREAGGNVFFETDFQMNLQTIEFSRQPAIISVFDIPQGIYYHMKWDIYLKCLETVDYGAENYPCIGIVISGFYEFLNGSVVPFDISIDTPVEFNIRSKNPDGSSRIVLSVNKEYVALVLLDPATAFHSISRESFEKAEISNDSGNPKIIISSSQNTYLYEILLYWIFQSATVIVK